MSAADVVVEVTSPPAPAQTKSLDWGYSPAPESPEELWQRIDAEIVRLVNRVYTLGNGAREMLAQPGLTKGQVFHLGIVHATMMTVAAKLSAGRDDVPPMFGLDVPDVAVPDLTLQRELT